MKTLFVIIPALFLIRFDHGGEQRYFTDNEELPVRIRAQPTGALLSKLLSLAWLLWFQTVKPFLWVDSVMVTHCKLWSFIPGQFFESGHGVGNSYFSRKGNPTEALGIWA